MARTNLKVTKVDKGVKVTLTGRNGGSYTATVCTSDWIPAIREMVSRFVDAGGLVVQGDETCMRALKKAGVPEAVEGKDDQITVKIRRSDQEFLDFILRYESARQGKRISRSDVIGQAVEDWAKTVGR